ncbi:nuclear transport factor 2 family protein [Pseudomonas sp. HN11]|uniref:nuclear transport factor 2 family protein n=1 Tax=Pseudomonas sp. HN11 TaxID=1344094 RepID=UPI001F15DA9F|nr:nuclear transport factor 2 family protein [Pseudomonas sp. HN11]UII69834.1 nuclear transport factor 2 family protein [Pseudomonas sp. HN11]
MKRSIFQRVVLVILLGLGSWSCAARADTQVENHNKQRVTEAFERWRGGGSTFFSDMLTPDVIWTIKGSGPSAGVYRGVDAFVAGAVKPFVSRLSSPVRPVSQQVWADGDHVIIQWEGAGVARDGQAYRNSYAWIFHMRDGKAFEVTAFLDLVPYDDVLRRIPE